MHYNAYIVYNHVMELYLNSRACLNMNYKVVWCNLCITYSLTLTLMCAE